MPYTYRKVDNKYCVYKKDSGKQVGCTDGNETALKKYLTALRMHEGILTDPLQEDLRKWVKQRWVDISRTKPGGGHPACGASADSKSRSGGKRAYPKCVPASKAAAMSDKEKESATRRKRDKYSGKGKPSKKAINVKTEAKGEKDACYYKVKARYDVWPSAYGSLALSACRKVGAANWGKKKKTNEIDYHSKLSRGHKPDWYQLHNTEFKPFDKSRDNTKYENLDPDTYTDTGKSSPYGSGYQKVKELNEVQGKTLHVYDFDDTLVKTKSDVIVQRADGSNYKLDSHAFATHKLKPGEKYDFANFDKIIDTSLPIMRNIQQIKKSLANPSIKTTILTARRIAFPIMKHLRDSYGINTYVVGTGSSDPEKKADWIEKQINRGYTNIKFMDDSLANLDAVQNRLQDKNVKLTLINATTGKQYK